MLARVSGLETDEADARVGFGSWVARARPWRNGASSAQIEGRGEAEAALGGFFFRQ